MGLSAPQPEEGVVAPTAGLYAMAQVANADRLLPLITLYTLIAWRLF